MSILNLEGAHENELTATGELNPKAPRTALTLPTGRRIVLPTEILLEAATGDLTSGNITSEGLPPYIAAETATSPAETGPRSDAVIPLVEEQLEISKTEIETARVRLHRETEEYVETVTVPLTDVHWEIEHVPIQRVVDEQPEIRQVGDTIIFPLVEERLVVKRELWLREEVHVHKVRTVIEKSAEFPLKRDVLIEERDQLNPS